jgi:hypothetical protein
MKNNRQLRNELCKIFNRLKSGDCSPAEAKEMNNAAGKIIGTVKIELEYASLCGVIPQIQFLEDKTE